MEDGRWRMEGRKRRAGNGISNAMSSDKQAMTNDKWEERRRG